MVYTSSADCCPGFGSPLGSLFTYIISRTPIFFSSISRPVILTTLNPEVISTELVSPSVLHNVVSTSPSLVVTRSSSKWSGTVSFSSNVIVPASNTVSSEAAESIVSPSEN